MDRHNTKRAIEHFQEDGCPSNPFKASSGRSEQSSRPAKGQQTLQFGVPTISHPKMLKLDDAAALAVYMGSLIFV
jgi:hypothetical protein